MAKEIKIMVDDAALVATEGEYLGDVLKRNNIFVPTMCDHEELEPYGVCRICIVEHDRGDWRKVVTSCNFPVKDGQKFYTKSEKIIRERKMVMELILARSSKTPEVVALAKRIGVDDTRFPKEDKGCTLCGACVRACEKVVGVSAIGFSNRGPDRKVSAPFECEAERCIGCGSCYYVCPVNFIKMEDKNHKRSLPLWKVELEFARCKTCGLDIAPKKQLDYFIKKWKLAPEMFDNCMNCRK